jgi:regulation of enolase protein 1 (concanavalin A-like superfamily)
MKAAAYSLVFRMGMCPRVLFGPTFYEVTMFRKLGYPSLLVALVWIFAVQFAQAQTADTGRRARPRISRDIDESDSVILSGNTHPDARQENDRGKVKDDLPMQHLLLQLRRSSEQEEAVQKFIDALHNPDSPQFHNWISAEEFGDRFGVADEDVDKVERWLKSQGLKVNMVYPSGMVIDFSGTAQQVGRAFGTEIHQLDVRGESHTGNMSDPQIPAALTSVVVGVVSLNDFRPRSMHVMRSVPPKFTFNGLYGTDYALVPGDLATIYNLNPLLSAGYSGRGQTIVLIEDTNVFASTDWSTFRSKFGLSGYTQGSFRSVHPAAPKGPNNCANPGVVAPNDAEAILDAEWASAAAPSAAIEMASCADTTTTFGGLIAIQNLINGSNPPAIMSVSYGQCEAQNGAAANAAYNSVYQQAVAEGVSIFVAAGDSGAAGCDNNVSEATSGVAANAFASTPYNVAVGGTDFSDTYSGTNGSYWNSTNTSKFASAQSYIPEVPWNNSCAGGLLASYLGYAPTYGANSLCNDPFYGPLTQTTVAGGGSPSACATGVPSIAGVVSGSCRGWPKPSWQSVVGNPNDGVRDTPDVSLFAADGLWSHYYVFCWSDAKNGGAPCTGDPSGWSGAGGTSFSAPIMAGIQALVNQKMGARQGNPNPVYYQLASAEYGSSGASSCDSSLGRSVASNCVFYDVTQGDMDVNCTGINNCYDPSGAGTQGVLSTSNNSFSPAYGTTTGWDFATGIGSVNATNLVNNWPTGGPIPRFSLSASPSSLTITQGSSGTSIITVNPVNGFNSSISLSASGLPNGVTAIFNPASATSTSTLTLTASATAATGLVNVTIAGTAGLLTNTTTIALTVNNNGNFTLFLSPNKLSVLQGASGTSSVTITPQNGFNGNVSLSASGLPGGVSASFSPNPATASSTLTLTASSTAATGTVTVTVTGTSGSLSNSTTIALTVTPLPLLTVWQNQDVGQVGVAGSASYANGTFTVSAGGTLIWGTADGMHFVYQPLSSDGTLVARVLSASSSSVTAGVMIRETLDTGSVNAFTNYYGSQISFNIRASSGGNTTSASSGTLNLPYWLKVTRSGSTFSGYISSDGVNWNPLGTSQNISMAQNAYVGLAVSGGSTTSLGTATFDNVSLSTATAPAPVISAVSTTAGPIGSQVMITGSGFGALQGSSMVILNGVPTTINTWSSSSISVTIPTGASSGPLAVSVAPSMNSSNPVTFTVTGVDYALSASPSSLSITQGSSGGSAVTVTPLYGFSGAVSLSASGLPSGVSASFSPNPATASSTLTLTASGAATPGTVTLTITGTSGGLTRTATLALSVTAPENPALPQGWLDTDIGQVGQAGSATYANGTFTLKGSGQYIYFNADSGHLVFQPLAGDATIVARVLSLQGGGFYQEAGVLIRETLNTDSENVYMAWGGGRPYLAWRSSTGGSTSSQTMSNVPLPYWVKLVRSGSTFTGYASADGVNWTQVSSQIVSMNTNVYVALATSAENNNTTLGTAILDNVSLSTTAIVPPVINGASATTGPIGSQVVITGSGFGTSQGNSAVILNGVPATINTWSDTSVTITIPTGASSGPLAVTVAPTMNSSNPITFTVTP